MDRIGGYRITRPLGVEATEGSPTVELYEAVDDRLGRTVLIKVLEQSGGEDDKSRFEDEVRGAARSGSTSLHELGRTSDGRPYAVYAGEDPGSGGSGRQGAGTAGSLRGDDPQATVAAAKSPRRGGPGKPVVVVAAALGAVVLASLVLFFVALGRRPAPHGPVTVMILPFSGSGFEGEDAVLPGALEDRLLAALYRARGLFLFGRQSTAIIAARPDPAAEARKLGASWLVRGRLSRGAAGEALDLEFTELRGRGKTSASRIGAEAGQGLALAPQATNAVLSKLGVRITDEERAGMQKVYLDPRVMALNARALKARESGDLTGWRAAAALWEESFALDPLQVDVANELMRVWASIAQNSGQLEAGKVHVKAWWARMNGLAADPRVDPYLAAMARLTDADWRGDPAAGIKAGEEALALVPDGRAANLGLPWMYGQDGRLAEALAVIGAYARKEPLDPSALGTLAFFQWVAGKPGEAIATADRALAVDPANAWVFETKGLASLDAGDLPAARAAFLEDGRLGQSRVAHYLALVDLAEGKTEAARAVALKAYSDFVPVERLKSEIVVILLTRLGEVDKAIGYVKGELEKADTNTKIWLGCTRWLDALKESPGWAAIAAMPGLPERVRAKW